MIDEIIHCRLEAVNTYHFSDEWEQAAILFHKLCDLHSENAIAEMRAAYKVGFKDGATMMQEIQD